jgi:hypothetical protein
MVAVLRREFLKRNRGSAATVLCSQWFSVESGQIVIWTHHTAARDNTWAVAVLQLYGARPVSGTIVTEKKEELLLEIERQWDLGDAGLLDKDKYLGEVNLGDLETTLGEPQHYWLLAIKTA